MAHISPPLNWKTLSSWFPCPVPTNGQGLESTGSVSGCGQLMINEVGITGLKVKGENILKVKCPVPTPTEEPWGRRRGTPQKSHAQEPAGQQKEKCVCLGTSQGGTRGRASGSSRHGLSHLSAALLWHPSLWLCPPTRAPSTSFHSPT